MNRRYFFLARAIVALAPIIAAAHVPTPASAQMNGSQIMTEVYNRPKGNSMAAELAMSITNARGSVRERSIQQYQSDERGVEKKLMFFTAPADVKNTSFMTWAYDNGQADEQWIYLPAMRRIRRIASDSKSDSFMGSDFTYDDMTMRHPDADTHRSTGEETIKGKKYMVVESVPKEARSDYAKTLSWIDPSTYVGIRKDFVDSRGELVRRLTVADAKQIDGFWVITEMTMEDLSKKSSTTIKMRNVSFNNGLGDDFFSERQMQKGPQR